MFLREIIFYGDVSNGGIGGGVNSWILFYILFIDVFECYSFIELK